MACSKTRFIITLLSAKVLKLNSLKVTVAIVENSLSWVWTQPGFSFIVLTWGVLEKQQMGVATHQPLSGISAAFCVIWPVYTVGSRALFWCHCQHNCYPLYNRCAYSNCPSWLLFISVIFQPQLRASCLRLRWLSSCIKMLRTVCMWPAATVLDYNIKNIRNNIRHTRNILEKRLHSTHKCRAHSHSSQSLMGINKSEP